MFQRVSSNVLLQSFIVVLAAALTIVLSAGAWDAWRALGTDSLLAKIADASGYGFRALHNLRLDRSLSVRALNVEGAIDPGQHKQISHVAGGGIAGACLDGRGVARDRFCGSRRGSGAAREIGRYACRPGEGERGGFRETQGSATRRASQRIRERQHRADQRHRADFRASHRARQVQGPVRRPDDGGARRRLDHPQRRRRYLPAGLQRHRVQAAHAGGERAEARGIDRPHRRRLGRAREGACRERRCRPRWPRPSRRRNRPISRRNSSPGATRSSTRSRPARR